MYIIYIYDIHSCKHTYIHSFIDTYIHSFIDTYIRSKHSIHSFTCFNLEFCRLMLPPLSWFCRLCYPLCCLSSLFFCCFHSPCNRLCSLRIAAAASARLVVPPLVASILGSCCHNYCDKKFTGMHKKYTHGHNTYINIHMQ